MVRDSIGAIILFEPSKPQISSTLAPEVKFGEYVAPKELSQFTQRTSFTSVTSASDVD